VKSLIYQGFGRILGSLVSLLQKLLKNIIKYFLFRVKYYFDKILHFPKDAPKYFERMFSFIRVHISKIIFTSYELGGLLHK
jgi:hypothetical protein